MVIKNLLSLKSVSDDSRAFWREVVLFTALHAQIKVPEKDEKHNKSAVKPYDSLKGSIMWRIHANCQERTVIFCQEQAAFKKFEYLVSLRQYW